MSTKKERGGTKKATYRITITADMVTKILHLAKTEQPLSTDSIALVGKFAPLQAKIDNLAIAPAYITAGGTSKAGKVKITEKVTKTETYKTSETSIHDNIKDNFILQALGGAVEKEPTLRPTLNKDNYKNKEDYWKACYLEYITNAKDCTAEELYAAKEHMYLEDLMSAEEVREFEEETATFSSL